MNSLKTFFFKSNKGKILDNALTLRLLFFIIQIRCSLMLNLLFTLTPSSFSKVLFQYLCSYFYIRTTLFTGDRVNFITICFQLVV